MGKNLFTDRSIKSVRSSISENTWDFHIHVCEHSRSFRNRTDSNYSYDLSLENHIFDFNFEISQHSINSTLKADFWEILKIIKCKYTGNLSEQLELNRSQLLNFSNLPL